MRQALPLFCQYVFQRHIIEGQIRNQVLEPAVLILQLLQPPELIDIHAAVLRFPAVERAFANAMRPANISDFLPGLG